MRLVNVFQRHRDVPGTKLQYFFKTLFPVIGNKLGKVHYEFFIHKSVISSKYESQLSRDEYSEGLFLLVTKFKTMKAVQVYRESSFLPLDILFLLESASLRSQ